MVEPTVNVLETACFPAGCLLPYDLQIVLAAQFVSQLRAAGMNAAEWTRGAQLGEEPYVSTVKSVVCRPCKVYACPSNPHFASSDGLRELHKGRVDDRCAKGEVLLAQLVSELPEGVRVHTHQIASQRNPQLFFRFKRGDAFQSVVCEVGRRVIWTNESQQPLRSFEHLREEIRRVIAALG